MIFKIFHIVIFTFLLSLSHGIAAVSSSIPFEISNGLILIKAQVNDVDEGLFIFDTGSSDILINGRSEGKSTDIFESVNGAIHTQKIMLSSLQLGAIKKRGISAYVTDLSGIEAFVEKKIYGIINGAYFSPNEVLIDLKNKRIEISPAFDFHKYSEIARYKLSNQGNITLVKFPFKGKTLHLGLDSGASSHILSKKAIDAHQIQYVIKETLDLINHQGMKQETFRIQTEAFITDKPEDNLFLIKDLDTFNEMTAVEVDGFLSITALPAEFVYLNRDDHLCIIGNFR